MPLVDRVTRRDVDHAHDAAGRRLDDVLHLHRFHDQQLLAERDGVTLRDIEGNDACRAWAPQRTVPSGPPPSNEATAGSAIAPPPASDGAPPERP